MYNYYLEKLLENEPYKTTTRFGIRVRKILYPLLRIVVPMTIKRKMIVVDKAENKIDSPVIFVSTHEFREDVEAAYLAAGVQTYIVNGSVSIIMNTFSGISNYIAGMILVNRSDKDSRQAALSKMKYVLSLGGNVLIYPEGTWNKSPNQIISGLFPGVYYVAKETGAKIIPMAHQREGKIIYSKVESVFDISNLSKEDAMELIKEKLATLKYELIEEYSKCRREDLPESSLLDDYWQNHIDGLMGEVPFYDYELELHTKYVDKEIVLPMEAYGFFRTLKANKNNAFLFRGNQYYL